ncbi:MAG: prohibitin family protein [Deltaproteobacteria bacterium]|jgi:prohibitin 2|nr:prohibitin family protein [Deltaproteobacteria bacterium]
MDPATQIGEFFKSFGKFNGVLIGLGILVLLIFNSSYVVPPGHRGVLITLGKVSPVFSPEGLGFKLPFITSVVNVSIKQATRTVSADCYSSDLQQIKAEIRVLYRVPENSIVKIFQEYSGDAFDSLIYPRVSEALKEVTALQSAEQIVKKREEIKTKALLSAKAKVGDILIIEDLVIQDVSLSKELETAIESKMVQEQEAAKAKFTQQKAEIEANTAIIKAKGEAEAIRVRGRALQESPGLVQLQIVEKWNGISPLVVGGGQGSQGANILLPIGNVRNQ